MKTIEELKKESESTDEMMKQISMGWHRGFELGIFVGSIGMVIIGFIVAIIIRII